MSVLEIKDLFSRPGAPAYPFRDSRDQLCWLESITEQGGRVALKQRTGSGERIVTPEGYQIRSRVHEYGGKCFCIAGESIYFNNFEDGLVYRQELHSESIPVAVVQPGAEVRGYADLFYAEAQQLIVAVQEVQAEEGSDNLNQLVAFSTRNDVAVEPQVIARGADFYAAPCVSGRGDLIAWLQWDHPYMPWDACSLVRANLKPGGDTLVVDDVRQLAGSDTCSVCQPGFLSNGDLVFAMDMAVSDEELSTGSARNFWNLYLADQDEVRPLTRDQAEYGEAHWVFGQSRWIQQDQHRLLAIATRDESDSLVQIDLETLETNVLGEPCARLSQISVSGSRAFCVAEYNDRPAAIIEVDLDGELKTCKAPESWLDTDQVSYPELVCYPTRDGGEAFANFYPASVVEEVLPVSLVVLVHGGPTSRADASLKPLVQYFAQNGFAVLDVNHRGSTGHGRAYRQALLGQWGEIDADDIADAIGHVCADRGIDESRVFIRGGSAGGYAVLRALTRYPQMFCGGACYYGIGNLITLAEITHKFEGRYTDRLIGENYSPQTASLPESKFRSRSPIFDIERIQSPLILFQGLDDKVVPPEVSREIVRTLKQNDIRHEYVEYAGEGHGFRRAETKIDSLQREINFYQDILKG